MRLKTLYFNVSPGKKLTFSLLPEPLPERRILCIGLVTMDFVQLLETYPEEDTDNRSIAYYRQRGGNASNNSTVFSKLGAPIEFLGVFSSLSHTSFLTTDMTSRGIIIDHCVYSNVCDAPTSFIILAREKGSRTIIHRNAGLPEPKYEDFEKLDLHDYTWIHVEGRNCEEAAKMMERINDWNQSSKKYDFPITLSVELERPRKGAEELAKYADVIFVSREFADSHNCPTMEKVTEFVSTLSKPEATIITAFGTQGSMAVTRNGTVKEVYHAPAYVPDVVEDTLGAGDTFIASCIFALYNRNTVETSLYFASRVTGLKVSRQGYSGVDLYRTLLSH